MAGRWILGASSVITTLSAFVSAAPAAYSNASGSVSDSPASAATLAVSESGTQGGSNSGAYHSPAYLTGGSNPGHPRLSQQQTNGNSVLGTFKASKLGQWVQSAGQPMPAGTPWGTASASNTNYYTNTPNTGMTRFYDFTITQGVISPDGVNKTGILVNGAFPGPTIEANWGDWIQVTLNNQLADEGTSLHWHGLLQKATPWMDGVPGVQQCPIAPGSSFTYRFKADLYGTSWYHSHYSAQYAGGALGAMIIHGPTNAQYDEDLGPIILSDWYHEDYYTLVEQVMSPAKANAGAPTSNNNLINGKMNYPCENTTLPCTPNAGISKFNFTSGKKYRLRLINASAEGIQKFSIDNHTMTVVANDFVEIEPYTTNVVTLGVGQRSDVIVEATGTSTDAVWMRSNLGPTFADGGCSTTDGISPEAVAVIYYQNANTTAVPTTTSDVTTTQLITCANDPLSSTKPFYPINPPTNPATTEVINITFAANTTDTDTAYDLWWMNNSTFRADYNDPVLLEAKLGHDTYPEDYNVHNYGSNSSIRLVVYNYATFASHPMHMHGHNVYILDDGVGLWDGTLSYGSNPQRRDVQLIQKASDAYTPGRLVLQIDADNPGVWPFHCHIAWHVSAGLYMSILERPDDVEDVDIPGVMAQTCRDWSAWTGGHIPDQIDSGL